MNRPLPDGSAKPDKSNGARRRKIVNLPPTLRAEVKGWKNPAPKETSAKVTLLGFRHLERSAAKSKDQFRTSEKRQPELIPQQFFGFTSLAQNDIFPAAVSPPEKARDDGLLKERLLKRPPKRVAVNPGYSGLIGVIRGSFFFAGRMLKVGLSGETVAWRSTATLFMPQGDRRPTCDGYLGGSTATTKRRKSRPVLLRSTWKKKQEKTR